MEFFNSNYNDDFLKSQKKLTWDSYEDFIRLKNKSFSDITKFVYAFIYDFFFVDHVDSVLDRIFFYGFLILIVIFWICLLFKVWDPKLEKIEFYEAMNEKPIKRLDLIAEAIDSIANSKFKNLKTPDYTRIKRDFKDSASLLRLLRKKYNPSKLKIQPIKQTEVYEELSNESHFSSEMAEKPKDGNKIVCRKYGIKKSKSQTNSDNELTKSQGILKFPELLPKRSFTSIKKQTPFSKITIKKPDFNTSKEILKPLSESCKKNWEKQRSTSFVLLSGNNSNKSSSCKESVTVTPRTSIVNSDKNLGIRNTSKSPLSKSRSLSCGPVLKSSEHLNTKETSNSESEKSITSKNRSSSVINKKTPTEQIESSGAKKEDSNIAKETKYTSNKEKSKYILIQREHQHIDNENLESLSGSIASEVTESDTKIDSDLKSATLMEVTEPDNALPKNIKSNQPKEKSCKLESTKKCQAPLRTDKELKQNKKIETVGILKLNKLSSRFPLSKRNKTMFLKTPKSKTAIKESEDKKNKYKEFNAAVQKAALKRSPTLLDAKKVGFKVKRFMYYKESKDELKPVEHKIGKKVNEKECQKETSNKTAKLKFQEKLNKVKKQLEKNKQK